MYIRTATRHAQFLDLIFDPPPPLPIIKTTAKKITRFNFFPPLHQDRIKTTPKHLIHYFLEFIVVKLELKDLIIHNNIGI